MKKHWLLALAAIVIVGVQFVPYGRSHTNPPIRQEPAWDRPETRELAKRACFDCHSNETRWPWYTSIAPVSWLTQRDVDEGRRKLNLSESDRPQREAGEAAQAIRKGEMPQRLYLLAHSEARLDTAEREALVVGIKATLLPNRPDTAISRSQRQDRGNSEDH